MEKIQLHESYSSKYSSMDLEYIEKIFGSVEEFEQFEAECQAEHQRFLEEAKRDSFFEEIGEKIAQHVREWH